MSWIEAIDRNRALVREAEQSDLAAIVSGSLADGLFWDQTIANVKRDILRQDGRVQIVSLAEDKPLGNFLGTVNAWREMTRRIKRPPSKGVCVLNMVFGKGKRLSPFTQALGNRKAAFPTPFRGEQSGAYLRTGDLAMLYSNSWLQQLRACGFNGLLVKWGDEAVIPSLAWQPGGDDFRDMDLIRFGWKTQPTEVLAREKEWFVINNESGLIERLVPRQSLASLALALRIAGDRGYSTAVNLGSVAVSYAFLDLAAQVFGGLLDGRSVSADWDPFTTLLLLGGEPVGPAAGPDPIRAGLAQAEARCPGFVAKVSELRSLVLSKMGRPMRVGFLDFGEALWVDLGLHTTLQRCLESLTIDDAVGHAMRAFFAIPQCRDQAGNWIVRSSVPPSAQIADSVIIDSTILDPRSDLCRGVVVGSRHTRLSMPFGGASLFSTVDDLGFEGGRGIAFRSLGAALRVGEGGRHTSLVLEGTHVPLVSGELIQSYEGSEYDQPVLGNILSFGEAAERVGGIDPRKLDEDWQRAQLALGS
jgi:hypothetical protein